MTETLCVICAADLAAPLICARCEQRIRRDLDHIGAWRKQLHDWQAIDPGTPGRDDRHLLALVDSPVITQSGSPDLTVIAATDPRSRRIVAGWHDTECGDTSCTQAPCTDPDHRQDAADDVVCIDHELITEARLIAEQRTLSTPIADVHDAIRILVMSHDWSVRDERVDEHAAVLASCAAALRLVLRDTGDPSVGRCMSPALDENSEEMCNGALELSYDGPVAESLASPTGVKCRRCGDSWAIADLVNIGRVSPLRVWETPPKIAAMLGMSERTLRHWIAFGKVRRNSLGMVCHADAWSILKEQSDPRQRQTAEGQATT